MAELIRARRAACVASPLRLTGASSSRYTCGVTLAVQHLVHRYGEVEALRGISAQAAPGAITAVIGPNASGKSTLLRCIIGAIRPTSGGAIIDGKPAHSMSAYHLAQKVAYVPQRSVVSAAFTVREVVELGRYARPADRAIIDEAIDRLELKDIEDRPYPALSVGQQQRVTLARALAQLGQVRAQVHRSTSPQVHESTSPQVHRSAGPQVGASTVRAQSSEFRTALLVLDEPMSAMDLRHARDCVKLLRELADAGVTVLMAMHDLALAERVADEAWLLNDGRLAASGAARDVLQVQTLRDVFGVDFEWALRADGGRVLVGA